MDSQAFLPTSLESLVQNLKSSGIYKFKRLIEEYPEHCDILSQKCEYFYDYAKDFGVFSQTSLPPKECFYNKLKEEHITDQQYQHAQTVFKETGCQTLLDYMHLYVKTDTLLLCDVFESFRDLGLEYYGLDCCHYMSLPGFSWDSMLNGALNGLTGVVKAAIIFFVFAGILFDTPVDALGGIMGFVDTFLNGGLTGLLVLVVFLSWL